MTCRFEPRPRTWPVIVVFACMAFPGLTAPTGHGLPDLIINRSRIVNTVEIQQRSFAASDCAVIEGCVRGSGRRTLLLFDAAIANIGTADVVVGSPVNNPLFEYSPCHGHYHFRGLATYRLLTYTGAAAVAGRKQSFCIFDTVRYSANAPRSSGYDCDDQGLTRGWEDVYSKGLDCQWLDITGVRSGNYRLVVSVNLERRLPESTYRNNTVSVPIRISYVRGVGLRVSPLIYRRPVR